MNTYEEKRQARVNRYKSLAEKKARLSEASYAQAKQLASVLPFGQPILVGHHSEARHRRLADKIHNAFGKSFALDDTAKYYETKANAAANNTAISSDDPEAITKLKAKIATLEADRDKMKTINKAYKAYETKQETKPLIDLGYKLEEIEPFHCKIQASYSWCRQPYPSFTLTNLGATIRTAKQRLEALEKTKTLQNSEIIISGIRILQNIEANRLQVFFPTKPSQETISELKRGGFRWSPTNGAWQAYRKQRYIDLAKTIANSQGDSSC